MHQHNESIEDARQREYNKLEELRKQAPEQLTRPAPMDPEYTLNRIGITGLSRRPNGFIRHHMQDFVVEEVASEGNIATIEPEESPAGLRSEDPTLYAELVKCGLGTLEAISHLAETLHCKPQHIRYAGIKDTQALTSQLISLRGIDWKKTLNLPKGQFFLKPKKTGKGALTIGNLQGNRFTILVRTEHRVQEQEIQTALNEKMKEGFANFYGPQRFGSRLLNPILGKLLCQGKPQEAIKIYLTDTSPYDIPIFQHLRLQAAEEYGSWSEMKKVFDVLPYSFRYERAILNSLAHAPENWTKALYAVKDQVLFWMYGYVSYLINKVLSEVLKKQRTVPEPFLLPLGSEKADKLYSSYLHADATTDYRRHLKPYTFFIQKERTLAPWIQATVHHVKVVPSGVILSFTLPKAAYATTFLMSLFNVYEGLPHPSWVSSETVDTKALLGTGSAAAALEKLVIPPRL